MSVLKTTVYLDEHDYRRLKAIGRETRRSPAALVREAVSEYARKRNRRKKVLSLGVGHSGRGDVAERADELLEGMGREEKAPRRTRKPGRRR
jgi:predicted transcriptional regulator